MTETTSDLHNLCASLAYKQGKGFVAEAFDLSALSIQEECAYIAAREAILTRQLIKRLVAQSAR